MVKKDNLVTDDKSFLFNDLMLAIKKDLMYMVYQPQYDLKTNKIVGVEALLRYTSKEYGVVRPDVIADLFQEEGLMSALDLYVIRKVFEDYETLLNFSFVNRDNFTISINISGNSLNKSLFLEKVLNLCEEYNIENKYIVWEITERELYDKEDLVELSNNIDIVREKGFKVAIDDFGVGSSNLSLLNEINVDFLKIDRCFLKKSDKTKRILRGIAQISSSLGILTIGEGAETKEDTILLEDIGCNYCQGFYFAKPKSLTELEEC